VLTHRNDPSRSGANLNENDILWAALPLHDDAWVDIVRGALRAFEITPDGKTLTPIWTSYCAEPNDNFNFAKYVPPTVANGKVYLATFSNLVNVYGVRPSGLFQKTDCDPAALMQMPSSRKQHEESKATRINSFRFRALAHQQRVRPTGQH
jgi:hypothetical protein